MIAAARTWAPLLCVAALAAAGCAKPGPRRAPVGETVDVDGFAVPKAADDFQLVETHAFDRPELGKQIRFQTFYIPAARIDVFLFPVLVPELFSLASVLNEQQRAMLGEIERTAQNAGGSVAVLFQRTEALPGTSPPIVGIRSAFDFVDAQGQHVRSHAFVAIRGRHYLKVRMSYPAESDDVGTPAFERFLATAVADIASSPAGDPEPVGITITHTTFDAGHGNACAAVAWGLGYGSSLHEAIGRGEFADTFDRELAARAKAVELWRFMKKHGTKQIDASQCVDASLDAMVEVERRGFLEEYVWRSYAKPYWVEPRGLDLAKFDAWRASALAGHDPVLVPGVVIHWQDAAPPPPP